MKMKEDHTRILDYGNAAIYPGFMYAHTHDPMAGQRLAFQCDFTKQHSMLDYVSAMAEYIKQYPDRKFYLGAEWTIEGDVDTNGNGNKTFKYSGTNTVFLEKAQNN